MQTRHYPILVTGETEPLGQKLHQTDPAQLPEPQPNQIYFQSADDPQWQCAAGREFYGSFSAMPFHCQKRMLQDIDNTLEMIYEPEGIPETPKAVTHGMTDSPLPTGYSPDHGMSFASKSMMSFALTASSKKSDKNNDDDCGVGKDQKPCVVNVKDDEPRPLVIPDFRDASKSGGQDLPTKARMSEADIQSIKDGIKATVTGDCADFITKLAETHLGKKIGDPQTFLLQALKRITDSPAPFGPNWSLTQPLVGEAWWGKPFPLTVKEHEPYAEILLGREGRPLSDTTYRAGMVRALHEIFHVAAQAFDQELSVTVRDMGIKVVSDDGKSEVKFPTDVDNRNYAYSGYWGQALKNHCSKTASYNTASRGSYFPW